MTGPQHPPAAFHGDMTLPPLLVRRDPATAPEEDRLVETALQWISVAREPGPLLSAWAQYAAAASQRMHPPGNPLRQRAMLADAAIRAGILPPADGTDQLAAGVLVMIGDLGATPTNEGYLLAGLHAYAGVHAHGHCAIGHAGLRHLRLPTDPQDRPRDSLLTTVIVSVALLSACDRDDLAAAMLEVHDAHLEAPGTPGRALFACLALDLADRTREHRRGVCTHPSSGGHDRHRFSALLHGEAPDAHTSPAPLASAAATAEGLSCTASSSPAAGAPFLPLDGIVYGLSAHSDTLLLHRAVTQAGPRTSNVWLVCDTCRLALRLGASLVRPDLPDTPLAPIITAGQHAHRNAGIGRAVWGLFSDHCGHDLRTLTEISPAWRKYAMTPTDLIAAPGSTDYGPQITLDAYIDGWPNRPDRRQYRGANPPPHPPLDCDVSLVCLSCCLELVLGHISPDPYPAITIGGRNAADLPTATTAVFRMLTEHTGHDLKLFTDQSPWDYFSDASDWSTTIETGHGTPPPLGDITHHQYAHGWPEAPTRPHFPGAHPLNPPAVAAPPRTAS